MMFSEKLQATMNEIQKVGAMFYKTEITDDIVLYGLYRANQHESIGKLMYNSSMSIFMLRRTLDGEYDMDGKDYGKQEIKNLPFTEQTECLFKDAESYAVLTGSDEVDLPHVLLAILNSENHVVREYLEDEVDKDKFQKDLIELIYTGTVGYLDNNKNSKNEDKKEKALPKVIKNNCEDLTQQALNGEIDPIIGRHKEVDMIINTLSRRTKNNVLIVGPAGSGKTALVKGLTVRIILCLPFQLML